MEKFDDVNRSNWAMVVVAVPHFASDGNLPMANCAMKHLVEDRFDYVAISIASLPSCKR